VRVELDAALVGALATVADPPLAAGLELRLAVGNEHFAALVGAGAYTPATQHADPALAVTVRAPFDLGVRGSLTRGRLRPSLDLGLILGLLSIDGQGVAQPTHSLELDVALRLAPSLRIQVTDRLAILLGLQASVALRTYQLEVLPVGTVAETPRLWLGLTLGVAGRLH
jgi:hypothetical protein